MSERKFPRPAVPRGETLTRVTRLPSPRDAGQHTQTPTWPQNLAVSGATQSTKTSTAPAVTADREVATRHARDQIDHRFILPFLWRGPLRAARQGDQALRAHSSRKNKSRLTDRQRKASCTALPRPTYRWHRLDRDNARPRGVAARESGCTGRPRLHFDAPPTADALPLPVPTVGNGAYGSLVVTRDRSNAQDETNCSLAVGRNPHR